MSEQMHSYDVVITGGHVIDPANGISGRKDVGILDGKIAAVEDALDANSGRRVVDATGQIVTPGLVDLHTHAYWGATYWGVEPDPIAARSGVTTWIDVGSAGAYNFPGFREYVANRAKSRMYLLLNISSIGLVAPTWELHNPEYWDVDIAAETVERNRDIILGIKIRMDHRTTSGVGIEPMKRARELADRVGLPLMTHIGDGPPELEEVLSYMRPGDILTHCFTDRSMGIVGPDGHIRPVVKELQERGMVLDIGHGTGSFSFEVAEKMIADGVLPDAISTDIHQMAVQGPTFDMPTTMTKFLMLGLSLEDIIERTTVKPARAVGLDHLGTLSVGSVADVAIFEMEEGEFAYYDVFMNERRTNQRLVSTLTMINGHELPRQEERPLHFFAVVPDVQQPVVAAGSGVRVPEAQPVSKDEFREEIYEVQGAPVDHE